MTVSDAFTYDLWPSGKEVEVTEKNFRDFKEWLSTRDIEYASPLEKELESFKILAEENGELDALAPQIERIEEQLKKDLQSDLEKAKSEVMFLLREELAGRLFLSKGQLEASFSDDAEVLKAIEVLSDPQILNSTLSGQ